MINQWKRHALRAAAALMLAVGFAAPVQAWPDRPVTLAVPLGPGTSPDIAARILAEGLQRRLGRPFLVENRVGATGAIGTRAVINAAPDGHMLLVTSPTLLLTPLLLPAAGYDPLTQLRPITLLGSNPLVLVAGSGAPARTLPDLVTLARSRPAGAIDYGSPGGTLHLTMALMGQQAGIEMNHISFRTGGELLNALVAGTVPYAWVTQAMAQPLVTAGRLQALAQSSPQRMADLPTVPSTAEAGLPDLVVDSWLGLFGPRDLPAPLAAEIAAAVSAALADPIVAERLRANSVGAPQVPASLPAMLAAETATWRRLVEAGGLAQR